MTGLVLPDWFDAARVFSELGFFGVTAFLLWERFTFSQARLEQEKERIATDKELSIALNRLTDRLDSMKEALQLNLLEGGSRRGGRYG